LINSEQILFDEVSVMIEQGRRAIYNEVLNNKGIDYGKQIVVTLPRPLTEKRKKFEEKNRRNDTRCHNC